LGLCDWLVLATNVPAARWSAQALGVVSRCRWPIALLFKRGQQQWVRTFRHGRTGARVLVEVGAKLLGLGVVRWVTLLSGGPLAGRSPTKQAAVVRWYAWRLEEPVGDLAELSVVRGRREKALGR
jgi:hypothetical protein